MRDITERAKPVSPHPRPLSRFVLLFVDRGERRGRRQLVLDHHRCSSIILPRVVASFGFSALDLLRVIDCVPYETVLLGANRIAGWEEACEKQQAAQRSVDDEDGWTVGWTLPSRSRDGDGPPGRNLRPTRITLLFGTLESNGRPFGSGFRRKRKAIRRCDRFAFLLKQILVEVVKRAER